MIVNHPKRTAETSSLGGLHPPKGCTLALIAGTALGVIAGVGHLVTRNDNDSNGDPATPNGDPYPVSPLEPGRLDPPLVTEEDLASPTRQAPPSLSEAELLGIKDMAVAVYGLNNEQLRSKFEVCIRSEARTPFEHAFVRAYGQFIKDHETAPELEYKARVHVLVLAIKTHFQLASKHESRYVQAFLAFPDQLELVDLELRRLNGEQLTTYQLGLINRGR